tara:strand:+ start:1937 stop:2170 length:234 start_codon:yes stop_codon:yes gene_type:complete
MIMTKNVEKPFTLKEVADMQCIAIGTARNRLTKGKMPPSYRLGRLRLFDRESYFQWLEGKKKETQLSFDFEEGMNCE